MVANESASYWNFDIEFSRFSESQHNESILAPIRKGGQKLTK